MLSVLQAGGRPPGSPEDGRDKEADAVSWQSPGRWRCGAHGLGGRPPSRHRARCLSYGMAWSPGHCCVGSREFVGAALQDHWGGGTAAWPPRGSAPLNPRQVT